MSPRVTDVLRRIDHVNIFLLIAGTYTPVSFALEPFWRNVIIISMWACTAIAIVIHVIWINAPRWLYTVVYIIFGIYGLAGAYLVGWFLQGVIQVPPLRRLGYRYRPSLPLPLPGNEKKCLPSWHR